MLATARVTPEGVPETQRALSQIVHRAVERALEAPRHALEQRRRPRPLAGRYTPWVAAGAALGVRGVAAGEEPRDAGAATGAPADAAAGAAARTAAVAWLLACILRAEVDLAALRVPPSPMRPATAAAAPLACFATFFASCVALSMVERFSSTSNSPKDRRLSIVLRSSRGLTSGVAPTPLLDAT